MATLYCTTGADEGERCEVPLIDMESELLALRLDGDVEYRGDQAPRFDEVMKSPTYVVLEVYDSEPKTTLFPKSGFYHLRGLTEHTAEFPVEPGK